MKDIPKDCNDEGGGSEQKYEKILSCARKNVSNVVKLWKDGDKMNN